MNPSSSSISIECIEKAALAIDPVFRNSPQFVCEPLSDELGVEMLVKVETLNPIRSFKGRGADWLVSQLREKTPLVCASAGNFGQAMAYSCRKYQIPLTVYASPHANPLKIERMTQLGGTVLLAGEDFDAAKTIAKNAAAEQGARFIEDGLAIETVEGAGTIALELLRHSETLDALLIPLGNGALFNGMARCFKQYRPRTKIVAVQSAGAPAMVDSWCAGKVVVHSQMDTIADGIGVRVPIPEALAEMQNLIDDAILVDDATILNAMRLLHRHAGVVVEASGAVGVAAILENEAVFRGKKVATILCGGNLTAEQMAMWL